MSTNTLESSEACIKECVRIVALDRAKICMQISDLELCEIENTKKEVHGHWMTLILAAGQKVRITFKCHFYSDEVSHILQQVFSSKEATFSFEQIIDFMKEYCNLVAGGVKKVLADHSVSVAVSLPIMSRGVDEIFFPAGSGIRFGSDVWVLQSDKVRLVCSMSYEILDPKFEFSGFNPDLTDDDDFEFL